MVLYKTLVVPVHEHGAIEGAVEHLIAGALVAIPTETVYGLAADALNPEAVAKIFAAKGRPAHNPLICHVSNVAMADRYVAVTSIARKLMDHFWPGPLTFVLTARQNTPVAAAVSAGLPTIAMRCPNNLAVQDLITKLDRPIAAPSANPSGKLSPTSAGDVLADMDGSIPLILDGGKTTVGIESTIISVTDTGVTILRPGTVTAEQIKSVAAVTVYTRDDDTITAPGQLASHYAPNAAVRLNATDKEGEEVLIGFGPVRGDLSLSRSGDLAEAAKLLFEVLRAADASGAAGIAVAPIPNEGIGIAINDRLTRAAAPRNVA